jgi:Tfp pilus assembly protein PilN
MSTQTTTSTATFPKVNLLPPEIEEHRKFRHVQVGLAAAVVAALAVAGGLTLAAGHRVSSAQDDLAVAQAQNQVLLAKQTDYANVPRVYAQVEAAQSQLHLAMGKEIRWSYLLNDLSLSVPNNVWLTKVVMTQDVDGTASTATDDGTQYVKPGLGTVSFEGVAIKHTDVAAWLASIAQQPGYAQSFLTQDAVALETEDPLAGNGAGSGVQHKVYEWKSQVGIDQKALSKRYTEKAGS